MQKCSAHGMMQKTLIMVQKTQQRIGDGVSESNERIAKVEVTIETIGTSFSEYRKGSEMYRQIQAARMEELFALIKSEKNRSQTRWTPKAVSALLMAIFGSGGLGYAVGIKLLEVIK